MNSICKLLKSNVELAQNDGVLGVGFATGLFSAEECRLIIDISERQQSLAGTLGAQEKMRLTKRDSEVVFLLPGQETNWIYEKMDIAVMAANRSYQFDLRGFEQFQVATYMNSGHYDWHMDIGKGPSSTRKLGISLQLSNGSEYEGGDLEFRGGGAPPVAPRDIGTMIVFPSFMTHRVVPVTKGVRKSLVAWVHGNPFR